MLDTLPRPSPAETVEAVAVADIQTTTRTFKYRIYPTRSQVEALELHLREACRLYNAALQERRDAWRMRRESVSFYSQSRQLKDIRRNGDIAIANFTIAEEVLRRVHAAFEAFFRRIKSGDRPGYPRFRPVARFDSLDTRFGRGARIIRGRLSLHGVGDVKVKWHRAPLGVPKRLTIKRDGRRWFACVVCTSVPAQQLAPTDACVGLDVGLTSLAVLSDGGVIENPRSERASERSVRRARRALSRCRPRSARSKRAAAAVRKLASAVGRRREDYHHKVSRRIVNAYGYIAVEDLNIRGLARTRLARSIHDAGWASLINKIAYKAESAGRVLVRVNPRGTSQACLCGASVPKTLSDREHVCTECGLVAPRDLVSAQLIERLGRSQWSPTCLTGAVDHEARKGVATSGPPALENQP